MIECPRCLGIKEVFNPFENEMVTCPLCNSKGEVKEGTDYDPMKDDFNIDDYLKNE